MLITKVKACLGIFLLLCGCKIVTWEQLVVNCSIGADQDYFFQNNVEINFSVQPDKQHVEETIKLTRDGKNVETHFVWEDSALLIKPLIAWEKGRAYNLGLTGSLRMADGRIYSVSMQRNFIYGEKDKKLKLITVSLLEESLVKADVPFILEFNKSIQITSFNGQFSLSPFSECYTDFSVDGTTVTITPKTDWDLNTIYSWSLSNLLASDGYPLDRDYGGLFSTAQDSKIPQLQVICPVISDAIGIVWQESLTPDKNVHEKQAIGFVFSKPMDFDSIEAGVTFVPAIKGVFRSIAGDSCRYVFYPEENYQLNKKYRITIASSVKDTSGIKLYEERNIFFTSANNYLCVNTVTLDTAAPIVSFPAENVEHTLNMVGTTAKLGLTILFSTAIDVSLRKDTVSAVTLSAFFPITSANPSLESVVWNTGGTAVTLYWKSFTKSSVSVSNYYKLVIGGGSGGIKNTNGEYLEEDVCVIFKAL